MRKLNPSASASLNQTLFNWHQNVAESIEQDADLLTLLAQWRLNAYTSEASGAPEPDKLVLLEDRGRLLAQLMAPDSFVKVLRHVNHCDVVPALRRRVFAILQEKEWGISCTPRIRYVRSGLRVLRRATSGSTIHTAVWSWRAQCQAYTAEMASEMAEAAMCEASINEGQRERADSLQRQLDDQCQRADSLQAQLNELAASTVRYDRGLEVAAEVASSTLKRAVAQSTLHATITRQLERHVIRALTCWRDKCDANQQDLQPELDRWMDHFMLIKRERDELELRAGEAVALQVSATQSLCRWKCGPISGLASAFRCGRCRSLPEAPLP